MFRIKRFIFEMALMIAEKSCRSNHPKAIFFCDYCGAKAIPLGVHSTKNKPSFQCTQCDRIIGKAIAQLLPHNQVPNYGSCWVH